MSISWQKLKENANRINGFELPIIGGGASWEPKELDSTKARKLFIFLADKRVLYYEEEWEFMPRVLASVLNIREYLVNNILLDTDNESPLHTSCKELRNACVEFLDMTEKLERRDDSMIEWADSNYRLMRMVLGRIRRRFGMELLNLSILYKLDMEENLATIIPASPNYEQDLIREELI